MKPSHTIRPVFDDSNLVSAAGLVPALWLAERAGLHALLAEHLSVGSPNAEAKTASVVAGMLAGADSIDDMDLLRHGAMGRLFTGVRAPSTLGTFLRSFTHGHVQQLDAVGAQMLAGLAGSVPGLIAGGGDAQPLAFIDVDDTVREVHGYAKQAAAYGYTRQRGLNIQVAAISTANTAPAIARARLRRGNTASAAGAGRMLAQSVSTARAAGVSGQILCRADSAYYGHAFVAAAIRARAWFSVTARMTATVSTAIAGIEDTAWTAIEYPHATWEESEQRWISDAEIAEVDFVAFTGRRKAEHVRCRLIVRRVRRLQPLASDGSAQGELFATWRHHAFITNSTLTTAEADERHRDHAIIEQVIAELKDGPLAHLPSGNYAANAAWVACAVIAFNIARASAVAADLAKIRWASLRRKIINIPARIAATGRRLILHLPDPWPWAQHWQRLHTLATGPPHIARPDHPASTGATGAAQWRSRTDRESSTRRRRLPEPRSREKSLPEHPRWIRAQAHAAQAFKQGASTARYEVYIDNGGQYRWRAWRSSDRVASSGEAFASKFNAERAAANVRDNAGTAEGP